VAGRFLVISADAGTHEVVRRAFAKFGAEVEVCHGAAEGFARLERRYDGIVLDCEHDLELGMQLITGLRHKNDGEAHTPLIALLPPHAAAAQVLAAGATMAMHKPMRPDQLATSLRVSLRLTTPNEKAAAARSERVAAK
jgi:DNA-binding response OmpR family regulator